MYTENINITLFHRNMVKQTINYGVGGSWGVMGDSLWIQICF